MAIWFYRLLLMQPSIDILRGSSCTMNKVFVHPMFQNRAPKQRLNLATVSGTYPCKEKFVSQVVKIIERKKEDTQKVKRGWFTIEQMKNELKWSSILGAICTKQFQQIILCYIAGLCPKKFHANSMSDL